MPATRLCPNGHVVDATWETCPYCPAARAPRPPIPPTSVGFAPPAAIAAPPPAPPLPMPWPSGALPWPQPRPPLPSPAGGRTGKAAGATRILGDELAAEKKVPVVGWLVVLSGKHRGEDFRLRDGKNAIGSDPSNQIVLSDDHISSRHASINAVVKDGERMFVIRDLDSRNGTFWNEREEPIYHEELVDNDQVVFGTVKCKFKCL